VFGIYKPIHIEYVVFYYSVKFIMTIIVAEYMQVSFDKRFVGEWAIMTKCYHKLSGNSSAFMYVGTDVYFTESKYKSSCKVDQIFFSKLKVRTHMVQGFLCSAFLKIFVFGCMNFYRFLPSGGLPFQHHFRYYNLHMIKE
jgi:hypothetical protein